MATLTHSCSEPRATSCRRRRRRVRRVERVGDASVFAVCSGGGGDHSQNGRQHQTTVERQQQSKQTQTIQQEKRFNTSRSPIVLRFSITSRHARTQLSAGRRSPTDRPTDRPSEHASGARAAPTGLFRVAAQFVRAIGLHEPEVKVLALANRVRARPVTPRRRDRRAARARARTLLNTSVTVVVECSRKSPCWLPICAPSLSLRVATSAARAHTRRRSRRR